MQELVSNNKAFEQVSNDTVGMINILTGSKIKINEQKEETNMCLAIQQMQEDSYLLGQKSGEQLGLQRGEQLGIENLINTLYELGIPNNTIASKLQEKYNMSYQDSQDAISKYLH